MKRSLAAMTCCVMIMSGFAGCGKNSSSSTADSGAETSAAEGKADAGIYGEWEFNSTTNILIKEDDSIYMVMNTPTEGYMEFKNDGTGTVAGKPVDPGMFDFDGEVYRLHVETDNDLTLRRKEPNDGTEFFGRYIMESGTAYDQLKQGYENRAAEVGDDATFDESGIELEMDISEEGTVIVVMKEVGEVTSENTIHMVIDNEEADLEFTLDGDTMELAHSNGKTKALTRVK